MVGVFFDWDWTRMRLIYAMISKLRSFGRQAVLIGLLSMAGLAVAHAETIVVEGNVRVDKTTIQSYVSGQPLDAAKKRFNGDGPFPKC